MGTHGVALRMAVRLSSGKRGSSKWLPGCAVANAKAGASTPAKLVQQCTNREAFALHRADSHSQLAKRKRGGKEGNALGSSKARQYHGASQGHAACAGAQERKRGPTALGPRLCAASAWVAWPVWPRTLCPRRAALHWLHGTGCGHRQPQADLSPCCRASGSTRCRQSQALRGRLAYAEQQRVAHAVAHCIQRHAAAHGAENARQYCRHRERRRHRHALGQGTSRWMGGVSARVLEPGLSQPGTRLYT